MEELWDQYDESGDPADLITHYDKLAVKVARQYARKLPTFVLFDDLYSSALCGLWKAIERFDRSKGVPFESFARTKIAGAILDDIREEDHASRGLRDAQKKIKKAENELQALTGRPASTEELAEHLGMEVEDLLQQQDQIHRAYTISLDTPLDQEGASSFIDLISVDEDNREINEGTLLQRALEPLSKREKLLFYLHYFEVFSLNQCAPILGVTHPICCKLHFQLSERLMECYKKGYDENQIAQRTR